MNDNEKQCSWCGEIKLLSEFYKQDKINSKGEKYIYYHPECKECTKKSSSKWIKNNREQFEKHRSKYRKTQKFRDTSRAMSQKLKDYNRQWRRENKEYLNEYNRSKPFHKEHEISDEELAALYKYANYSCMYCGITEEEAIKLYGQKLHKDHAINDGSGGIENCILACKRCNVSKWNRDWDEWYVEGSEFYDPIRYEVIKAWLDIFKG